MPTLLPMQLTMVTDRNTVKSLPSISLPPGYTIRSYRPGDEKTWAETLQECGFQSWNETEVLAYLQDPERRRGSRVVEHNNRIVAATFASRSRGDSSEAIASRTNEGILDFVVTHPDHRDRGLGKATCTEVAKFFTDLGCTSISLRTDDWRLSAIHVYLSLGFKPVMNREDMPQRWANIHQKLKENSRDHS